MIDHSNTIYELQYHYSLKAISIQSDCLCCLSLQDRSPSHQQQLSDTTWHELQPNRLYGHVLWQQVWQLKQTDFYTYQELMFHLFSSRHRPFLRLTLYIVGVIKLNKFQLSCISSSFAFLHCFNVCSFKLWLSFISWHCMILNADIQIFFEHMAFLQVVKKKKKGGTRGQATPPEIKQIYPVVLVLCR